MPLLLRLVVPPVDEVVLMQGKREQWRFGGNAIRGPRLAAYPSSPLAGSANGSALEAFLDFARSENFTEVNA